MLNRCYGLVLSLLISSLLIPSLLFIFVCLGGFLSFPNPSLAISSDKLTADSFFRVGIESIQVGNYQGAIDNFLKAIELKEDFSSASYSNLCLANLQIEDYQSAIQSCTKAITLTPTNIEALLNRGLAHYRQGEFEAAIADDSRAIGIKPYDFRAYYNRALAASSLGYYQKAVIDYNRALSQVPQTSSSSIADIYNDRGLINLELQNIPAALIDFSLAIRHNSDNYTAYFNRGCVCSRNGYFHKAIEDFTNVIELKSDDASSYINRGVAYYHLGDREAAVKNLQIGAAYFAKQGQQLAFEQTLDLIENFEQTFESKDNFAYLA